MRSVRRLLVGSVGLLALVLCTASPALAANGPDVASRTIATSGSYCTTGGGEWTHTAGAGGTHYSMHAYTESWKNGCNNDFSPAHYDTLAVKVAIEKTNNDPDCGSCSHTITVCQVVGPYVNLEGDWQVSTEDSGILGCGSGWYRLSTEHRVIYNGVNINPGHQHGAWVHL